jgi:hypothetical protein
MREKLTTLGELGGLAAVATGFGMIWPPLGVIVGGLALFGASFAVGGDE